MPGLNHPHNNNEVDNRTIGPPPHLIQELNNNSIANLFCFGAFMDKLSGVVYSKQHVLFVMYHYETNSIVITPIAGLDSEHILEAYKLSNIW